VFSFTLKIYPSPIETDGVPQNATTTYGDGNPEQEEDDAAPIELSEVLPVLSHE
jgi:hypothetical protein